MSTPAHIPSTLIHDPYCEDGIQRGKACACGADSKDRRGRVVCVGDHVAYNLSGSIAYGIVKDIKPRKQEIYRRLITAYTFHVENRDGWSGGRTPGISKIKLSTNLLVIAPMDPQASESESQLTSSDESSAIENLIEGMEQ